MVDLKTVQKQLSKVGYRTGFWQRAEVKELCTVLHENEEILKAANGYYEGGFSLLVATDHRLLLVDRKPMFLTLDSIPYKMIQEISYNYRLLNSTLHIFTSNKCLDFSSWNHEQIRVILSLAQHKMKGDDAIKSDAEFTLKQKQPILDEPKPVEQLDYIPSPENHDVPAMPTLQSNFVTTSSNTSHNLANLALASTNFKQPEESANPLVSAAKAYANRQQYVRRYY